MKAWTRVLVSTALVGAASTSNFWTEAFGAGRATLYMAVVAVLTVAGNLVLLGLGERYERERRTAIVRLASEKRWAELRANDPQVRVSVMLCGWAWSWGPRRALRVVERLGFDDKAGDRNLALLRERGVAGEAIRLANWAIGIRTIEAVDSKPLPTSRIISKDEATPDMDRGLTPKQRGATKDRVFICSFPVRALGRSKDGDDVGAVKPLGEIIGTINVDSSKLEPYFERRADGWHKKPIVDQLLAEILPDLANVAGYIFG